MPSFHDFVALVEDLASSHEAVVEHVDHLEEGERDEPAGLLQSLANDVEIDESLGDRKFIADKGGGGSLAHLVSAVVKARSEATS